MLRLWLNKIRDDLWFFIALLITGNTGTAANDGDSGFTNDYSLSDSEWDLDLDDEDDELEQQEVESYDDGYEEGYDNGIVDADEFDAGEFDADLYF